MRTNDNLSARTVLDLGKNNAATGTQNNVTPSDVLARARPKMTDPPSVAVGTRSAADQDMLITKERSQRQRVLGGGAETPTPAQNTTPPDPGKARPKLPDSGFKMPAALELGYIANWGVGLASNSVVGYMGQLGQFGSNSPVSAALAAADLPTGMPNIISAGIDVVAGTARSYERLKTLVNAVHERKDQTDAHGRGTESGPVSFHDLRSAGVSERLAKTDLLQNVPGALRDVGGGMINVSTSAMALAASSIAEGFGQTASFFSPVGYAASSVLKHRALDHSEHRTHQLIEAITLRPDQNQPLTRATQTDLDTLLNQQQISRNMHKLINQRGEAPAQAFLQSLAVANTFDRTQNNQNNQSLRVSMKLLDAFHGTSATDCLKGAFHFSTLEIVGKAVNFTGRDSALNSPHTRDAVRSAVLDAITTKPLVKSDTESVMTFLDNIFEARARAIGRAVETNRKELDKELEGLGLPKGLFNNNTANAIIGSQKSAAFLNRFLQSSNDDQQQLKALLHFDRAAMHRPGAVVHNSSHERHSIRETLVKMFAEGYSLDKLEAVKMRLATHTAPTITKDISRLTERPSGTTGPIYNTLQGVATSHLEGLRAGKQWARYEGIHAALISTGSVAGLTAGPAGAVVGASMVRTAAFLVNIAVGVYEISVQMLDAKHKKQPTMDMKREHDMMLKPYLGEMVHSGLQLQNLADPVRFARTELGMNDSRAKLLEIALEQPSEANQATINKLLDKTDPLAGMKVAVGFLGESLAGIQGKDNHSEALHVVTHDPALKNIRPEIHALLAQEPPASATDFTNLLNSAYSSHNHNPLEMAQHMVQEREKFTFLEKVTGKPLSDISSAEGLVNGVAKLNPEYSVQVFAAHLTTTDKPQSQEAQKVLRNLNFTENQIHEISQMPLGEATAALSAALLDAKRLTRQFPTAKLDPKQLNLAAATAREVQFTHTADAPELSWRRHFENRYLDVIPNSARPGVESLVHAVLQASRAGQSSASDTGKKSGEIRAHLFEGLSSEQHAQLNAEPLTAINAIAQQIGQRTNSRPFTLNLITSDASGELKRSSLDVGRPSPGKAEATVFFDPQTQRGFVISRTPKLQPTPPADASDPATL